MTELYNLRSAPADGPGQFIITKFDKHLNVESSYLVSKAECACPAGSKPSCRHRKMLPTFIRANHVGDGWFLNWADHKWVEPVLDDIDAHAEPTEDETMDGDITDDAAVPSDAPVADEPEAVKVLPPASLAPTPIAPLGSSGSATGAPHKDEYLEGITNRSAGAPKGSQPQPQLSHLFVRPL